jgi:hypothetical protein
MCVIAAFWSSSNYLSESLNSPLWLYISYILGSLLIFSGLIWTQSICGSTSKYNTYVTLLGIIYLFTTIFVFNLIVFSLFYFFFAFLILISWHSYSRNSNKNSGLIFYGAFITLVITAINSLIFPLSNKTLLVSIDNFGFLIFISIVFYAIYNFNFLELKLISAQVIVGLLWITLIVKLFFSENSRDLIINTAGLVIAMTIGIALLGSVLQNQRLRVQLKSITSKINNPF